MNRREFFTALGVVGATHRLAAQGPPGLLGGATVRLDWLARHTEPILEPDLPIIDPHHHLWIRPGSRYLADDLLADMNSGHNFVATVYVQAQSMFLEAVAECGFEDPVENNRIRGEKYMKLIATVLMPLFALAVGAGVQAAIDRKQIEREVMAVL